MQSERIALDKAWEMQESYPDSVSFKEHLPMIPYREGYKTCPACGKRFFITDLGSWVYKMHGRKVENKCRYIYFDRYSCKAKYEREHPIRRAIDHGTERNCG